MSFVASRSLSLTAGVFSPLFMITDVSGNCPTSSLYSHMRTAVGGLVTFDSGQTVTVAANLDTVIAIPPNATQVKTAGTQGIQLGKMC